jgi:hypothetical protein
VHKLQNGVHKHPRGGFAITLIFAGVLFAARAPMMRATELGGSVYPEGVETVMPGVAPAAGSTMFLEFNDFYFANGLANSKGQSEVPGFSLGVAAFAPKIVHNWDVQLFGGTLVSAAAAPLLRESLTVPGAIGSKTGIGNPDLEPAAIAYVKGALHWYYAFDIFTPGFGYTPNAFMNIGQHNFGYAPVAAFTYLPDRGRIELSSKYQYIINGYDSATHYQSGREFIWEYDGMTRIAKNLYVGGNGFWYQQMTDDYQNGLIVDDGNRGRDFAFGPEIKYHLGHCALIAKYERDMLVQNRPYGNSFWIQFGMPLGHPRE